MTIGVIRAKLMMCGALSGHSSTSSAAIGLYEKLENQVEGIKAGENSITSVFYNFNCYKGK